VGAEVVSPGDGHPGMHPVSPGLIRARAHDPPAGPSPRVGAHDHRPPGKRWVAEDLDGGKETVHVGVQHDPVAGGCHSMNLFSGLLQEYWRLGDIGGLVVLWER